MDMSRRQMCAAPTQARSAVARFTLLLSCFLSLSSRATFASPSPAGTSAKDPASASASLAAVRKTFDDGLYAKAEAAARAFIAVEQEAGRQGPAAEAMVVLVEAMWRGGKAQDPETRRFAEQAVELARNAFGENSAQYADSLAGLGNLQSHIDEFAASKEALEKALALRETLFGPDSEQVAVTLADLAAAEGQMGNFPVTKALMERAYGICEKQGLWNARTAAILNNLGVMMDHLGDYEASRQFYRRALEVWGREWPPGHPRTMSALDSLAVVEARLGNYATARPLYEQALAMREKMLGPTHPQVGESLSNISALLARMGRYAEARPLQERALGIMEGGLGPDHSRVQEARTDLAWTLQNLGDLAKSYAVFQKVCATDERVLGSEHPALGRHLNAKGDIEVLLGMLPEAEKDFARGLAILEKAYEPGHPDTSPSLVGLGDVRYRQGRLAEAEEFYTRALTIQRTRLGETHPSVAESLIRLAQAHWAGRKPAQAFQESMDAETILLDRFGLSLRGLSEREALEIERVRASGMDLALSILAGAAAGELPDTALEQAWTALLRARALVLDQVASLRRPPTSEQSPEIDRLSRDLRSATGRLSDLMVRGPDPDHPGDYAGALQQATKRKEDIERQLAAKSPAFRDRLQRSKPTLADVRATLPSDAALVAYTLHTKVGASPVAAKSRTAAGHATRAYLAFVAPPGGTRPVLVSVGTQAEIDALIETWRKTSTTPPPSAPAAAARVELDLRNAGNRLRARLWDPVAMQLGTSRQVLIVPDGAIHLLSFATLPAGEDRYVVEEGPVLHYLSAERDLLAAAGPAQAPGTGALVVGGPDFSADPKVLASRSANGAAELPSAVTAEPTYRGLPPACETFRSVRFYPLPGATNEAAKIREILTSDAARPASRVLQLTAGQATEEAFKSLAPGKKILHIATHGFFLDGRCDAVDAAGERATPSVAASSDNPLLLSGLVLAGANRRSEAGPGEEDGILTSEEIATLDLSSVDWAVLSACETGLGAIQPGEGVLGLRRAFQIAGARTLIMSLWKVDDDSTREWMSHLYENRLASLSTAEAARRASVSMLQAARAAGRHTHPYFWGGFVATGDWR
jgi:CHAT domain-containing protein/Tfp pilus assembly protein PilF